MKKPNIVYIVADQWRGDCLGLYKNNHPVMTPHLNQLAAEGTLFTQAYADCPICMPQRVTMLTGKTGSQMRSVTNFNEEQAPDFDRQTTLPARLTQEAGYQTKAIGKMHFSPARSRNGFQHVTLHPNDYIWWLEDHGYGGAFRGHGLGGNEVYPAVAITPDKYYHTTWSIDEAIKFLDQRDPEMPFMLFLVFEAPHSPFDPPPPYDRMYDNFTISDPVKGDWTEDDMPAMYHNREAAFNWDELTPEIIKESRRRYYGQISQIDYHLGRLFGSLKSHGVDDDTAIIFTADHGENLGDHGLFAKHCFLESSAKVPMIVRPPANDKRYDRSVVHDVPVQTADLCPTFFDMLDLPQDDHAEGKSILPLLTNEEFADRILFGEVTKSAAAYNKELKYIYYQEGGTEQLFNIKEDPDDLHNIISDPKFAQQKDILKAALLQYLTKNKSSIVKDNQFIISEINTDRKQMRSANPLACRGPMRGGSGY
jgi:arylsulfatase A-like enzyme